MNQAFKQLESRIQELVLKLQQTGSENTQLNQKLVSVQQELEQKTRQLAAEREQHAKVADLAAQNSGSNDELSEKLQFQEHQLQLLERERLNLRDQIAFLQNTIQNKEKDWQERNQAIRSELNEQEQRFQSADAETSQKIEQLKKDLQNAEQLQSSLQQELDAQQQTQQQQNQQYEQQIHLLNQEIESKISQLNQLQKEVIDVAVENDTLKSQVQSFTSQLEEQKKMHQQALQEQQAQAQEALLQETENQKLELQAREKEFDLQKQEFQAEKSSLQDTILQLNNQNQQYRSVLMQSAAELRTLLGRLPDVQDEENVIEGENS